MEGRSPPSRPGPESPSGRIPLFVLASASPRRAALLAAAGAEFERLPLDVDETLPPGLAPEDAAVEIALRKARAATERRPGLLVLAADTIVVVDDRSLGKPRDDAEARAMLSSLSGREHRVVTAVAAMQGPVVVHGREVARVRFRRLAEDEIARYVATGEPRDKAGAYAIQGGAAGFVESLDGARDTVIGLPVALALDLVVRCDRLASSADGGASRPVRA